MDFLQDVLINRHIEVVENELFRKYQNYNYKQLLRSSRIAKHSYSGILLLIYILIFLTAVLDIGVVYVHEWAVEHGNLNLSMNTEFSPSFIVWQFIIVVFLIVLCLAGMHERHIEIVVIEIMVAKLEGYEKGRKFDE